MKKRKGYTLLQLIIVLGVMATFTALSTLGSGWLVTNAKDSSDKQTCALIASKIIQYKFQIGYYPNKLEDLTKKNGIYGPWLLKIPLDNSENFLNYAHNKEVFAVWSNGENGKNDSGGGVPTEFKNDDTGIISY